MASERVKDFLSTTGATEYFLVVSTPLLSGIIKGGRIPHLILKGNEVNDGRTNQVPDTTGTAEKV